MSNILLCAACTDDSVHAEHGREIEGLAVATATPLSLHSSFKARKDMECDPEKVRALVELLEADSEGAESMDLSGEPDIEFRQAFQKRVIEFWKLRLEARDCG